MSENESLDIEVIQPSAIEAIERAQVDIQISTARRYPRVISAVKQRMLSYATLDEETAASCFYTLPARKGGDGKALQGPSVRLAEIALASYQHVKAGSRIIGDDGKFITAQAVVHDLENNVSVSIEVKRRVTTKEGRRFSDDMIATTGNAATSIALRNAVFRVVPRALVMPVYEQAKKVAVGDVKSLVSRRAKIIERLGKMGVTVDRILHAVGVSKVEDIGLDHMEVLIGHGTSLKDGEYSIEDLFPLPGSQQSDQPAGPTITEKRAKKRDVEQAPEPQQQIPTPQPEPTPEQASQTQQGPITLATEQKALADLVAENNGTFDELMRGLAKLSDKERINLAYSPLWEGFHDIPVATCMKITGAKRWAIALLDSERKNI